MEQAHLILVMLGPETLTSAAARSGFLPGVASEDAAVAVFVEHHTPECVDVALKNGLAGVLHLGEEPAVILAAIDFIMAGGTYIPHVTQSDPMGVEFSYQTQLRPEPEVARRVPPITPEPQPDLPEHDFTSRQRDVLSYLADGVSNKEIANNLDLSEATVKSHVRQVMRKMNVQNRTQAALLARQFVDPINGERNGGTVA